MVKGRYHISVDPEVWNMAKHKISEPLSCFIQKQLEIACRLDNKKGEIEKELYEKEQEVIALRSQLCKLQKKDKLKSDKFECFDECMVPIQRIYDKIDKIGENQIQNIANQHGVDFRELVEYCKSKNLNVVEVFEFERESKMKKGVVY